jgi:SAM-dependent methyltransferase
VRQLDDPAVVAAEYADEERLRRRAAAFKAPEPGQPSLQSDAIAAIVSTRPRRVLEVGAGWGEFASSLAVETGAEVIALDISPRMVELARSRGVDARLGDVQQLPFADGEFDAAAALWMLYHVPDLDLGLSELARVLRSGGVLCAITNSAFHLHELRSLVGSGPSPSRFTRENGDELLARHFASVRRVDVDGTVVFADRAEVDGYVRASISMSPFVDNLPAAIDEPFRATKAVSLFVAVRGA